MQDFYLNQEKRTIRGTEVTFTKKKEGGYDIFRWDFTKNGESYWLSTREDKSSLGDLIKSYEPMIVELMESIDKKQL